MKSPSRQVDLNYYFEYSLTAGTRTAVRLALGIPGALTILPDLSLNRTIFRAGRSGAITGIALGISGATAAASYLTLHGAIGSAYGVHAVTREALIISNAFTTAGHFSRDSAIASAIVRSGRTVSAEALIVTATLPSSAHLAQLRAIRGARGGRTVARIALIITQTGLALHFLARVGSRNRSNITCTGFANALRASVRGALEVLGAMAAHTDFSSNIAIGSASSTIANAGVAVVAVRALTAGSSCTCGVRYS